MEQNYQLMDTNDRYVLEEKTCEDVLFSEVVAEWFGSQQKRITSVMMEEIECVRYEGYIQTGHSNVELLDMMQPCLYTDALRVLFVQITEGLLYTLGIA